jgi:hypothetical protein
LSRAVLRSNQGRQRGGRGNEEGNSHDCSSVCFERIVQKNNAGSLEGSKTSNLSDEEQQSGAFEKVEKK